MLGCLAFLFLFTLSNTSNQVVLLARTLQTLVSGQGPGCSASGQFLTLKHSDQFYANFQAVSLAKDKPKLTFY